MGQEALNTALLGMSLMIVGLLLMLIPSRKDRPAPMFPFVMFFVGLILLYSSTQMHQQERRLPAPPAETTPP